MRTAQTQLNDADQVLGHLRARRGKLDLYRYKVPLDLPPPLEGRPDPMRQVAYILGLTIVALLIFIAPLLWLAILTVAQQ